MADTENADVCGMIKMEFNSCNDPQQSHYVKQQWEVLFMSLSTYDMLMDRTLLDQMAYGTTDQKEIDDAVGRGTSEERPVVERGNPFSL